MRSSRAFLATLAFAFLIGCDAGITGPGGGQVTAFTYGFPAGNGCALRSDGSALCRGDNTYGFLGTGTTVTPANANDSPVDASTRFKVVTVGDLHACALDNGGAAWCWGLNGAGQLGVGDTTGPESCNYTTYVYPYGEKTFEVGCATRPVKVATPQRFRSLSSTGAETCGLNTGGELWCWGEPDDGFGLGGAALPASCGTNCPIPIRAAPDLKFRKVVTAYYASCGIATDQKLYCWGYDGYGRFGRDSANAGDSYVPTAINSSAAISDVDLASDHTCTLTAAGALMCFGSNYSGQLGDGTFRTRQTPLQVEGAGPFRRVAVRDGASCALDLSGKAWCWGYNSSGQLGLGHFLPAPSPEKVLGDLTFQTLTAGSLLCGHDRSDLWCWGQLPSRFEQ